MLSSHQPLTCKCPIHLGSLTPTSFATQTLSPKNMSDTHCFLSPHILCNSVRSYNKLPLKLLHQMSYLNLEFAQFHINQVDTCGRRKCLPGQHNHLCILTIYLDQHCSNSQHHNMVKLVQLRTLLLEFASKHMEGSC
jgi:hypothetical protein